MPAPSAIGWQNWVTGALFALLMSVGGYAWSGTSARIDSLEDKGSPALRERIAVTETQLGFIREGITRIETKQHEQDEKIERILSLLESRNSNH